MAMGLSHPFSVVLLPASVNDLLQMIKDLRVRVMGFAYFKDPDSMLSGEILAFTGKINHLIFTREPPEPIDLTLFLIE